MRVEYEYKLMLQPQQLNEQLREAKSVKEAAEHALDERTSELNLLKANAAEQQERFLADMEAQHAAATEQLEAAYDTRFAVSHCTVANPVAMQSDTYVAIQAHTLSLCSHTPCHNHGDGHCHW